MVQINRINDSRIFQIAGQSIFLLVGIVFLGWHTELPSFAISIFSCYLFQSWAIQYLGLQDSLSLRSSLITSLGLCLLLRVNHPILMVTAAALAIGQKFIFRWRGYHLWNPANFAIALLVAFSDEAWVSPGQWGHFILLPLLILGIGTLVLRQAKRWDTAWFYMFTLASLSFFRFVFYQGWEVEVWWHQFNQGTIWLYALFMITDPMTSPQHAVARRVWAVLLGVLVFYVQHFWFIPTAAVWVLFFMTPWVPLINATLKSTQWHWVSNRNFKSNTI